MFTPGEDRAETSLGAGSLAARLAVLRRLPRFVFAAVRLLRHAAPREAGVAVGLQVMNGALVVVQLLLVRALVVHLTHLTRGERVLSAAPTVLGLVAINAVTSLSAAYLGIQQRLMSDLVTYHTFERIMSVTESVDYARYEEPDFHDHLERARTAAMSRPIQIVTGVTSLITALVTSVGIVIALLALEPLLVPIVLVGGLPVLIVELENSRRAYAFYHSITAHGRDHLHLLDLLTGPLYAKELRTTAAGIPLRRRYRQMTEERVRRTRAFLARRLRAALLAAGISAVAAAIAIGALVWLVETRRASLATAAAALIAMQLLASRLQSINSGVGQVVEAGMFLEDYQTFLARDATPRPAAEPPVPPPSFSGLGVENVTFAYPGGAAPVLHDVSLRVEPGEIVALVGANGSGKTTLVKLICGLFDVAEPGRILWSGRDVRQLGPQALRREITVLFQDFVRYELTVEDNIVLGRGEVAPDRSRAQAAVRQAGLAPAVDRLHRGIDTRLGRRFDGGVELSGGQWQRLALARAFYRGGEVVILDEPTAALDPRGEYELFEHVRRLAAGKSVLLISHRFSSVRSADRIYVLQEGRVVESGTHDALIAREGVYAELYDLQAAAYFGSDRVTGS